MFFSRQKLYSEAIYTPGTKLKKHCSCKPPSQGYLELNVGGAMFSDLQKAGVGAIIWDENGDIVMAVSKSRTRDR